MAWFVNFVVAFVRMIFMVVRALIPIVVGFVVFAIVSAIVAPLVVGAFESNIMVLMVAGACGLIAGGFVAGFCWRL